MMVIIFPYTAIKESVMKLTLDFLNKNAKFKPKWRDVKNVGIEIQFESVIQVFEVGRIYNYFESTLSLSDISLTPEIKT